MINILHEIEYKLDLQPMITLATVKKEIERNSSGFYWIYTKKKVSCFQDSSAPDNKHHVNLHELSKIHSGLLCVIKQNSDEYWCIYNGKGQALRNRIVAEFSSTGGKTGTLALTRCFSEDDFKIKYITTDSFGLESNLNKCINESYNKAKLHLERIWRLNNGHPIFCRR